MLRRILKILSIFLIVVVVLTLYFYIKYYDDIKELNQLTTTGKFEYRVYDSPTKKNKITLMIHTKGWFDYTTHIYFIEGIYKEARTPLENFVKYPDGTGVFVEWESDQICKILSGKAPVVNNFRSNHFDLKIVVDREQMESQHKGEFVRYGFE